MVGDALWLVVFDWSDEAAGALRMNDALRLFRSVDGSEGRAYVATQAAPTQVPAGAQVSRIICTLDVPGASHGKDAPYHYVVSTDVLPEHEPDMNAWYDTEHLPGLASVPGTVRARRFIAADGGVSPRHHAAYDLSTRETHDSPPWLAVKATDWSTRVRPAFRNTERKMFERVV